MAFKILRRNCCGLDVHKTWIFACIGITDANRRTEYKQARFSSFSNGLRELAGWLTKHSCADVCMESTGKYWIPVFNILEKTCWVTLAHVAVSNGIFLDKQITVPMSLSFVDALESMLYRHRILRYLAIEDLKSCRRILLRG